MLDGARLAAAAGLGGDVAALEAPVPDACGALPAYGDVYARDAATGAVFRHDRRYMALENSLEAPCAYAATADASCPAVEKTFLNKDSCVVAPADVEPPEFGAAAVPLDEDARAAVAPHEAGWQRAVGADRRSECHYLRA